MLILNKYQIIEPIAKGGMGIIYKAFDSILGRVLAIKELSLSGLVNNEEKDTLVQRFKREAETCLLLNHPNIVTVYDFGSDSDRHFMVMEFLT
ncbi:MAG: protein kinase domain-containing protein, partial [Candidatus Sericytochromatia bacterium]